MSSEQTRNLHHLIRYSQFDSYLHTGETHQNFLLGRKENQAKFVAIFQKIVGWVERNSLMIVNLRGVSESPLCMIMSKI